MKYKSSVLDFSDSCIRQVRWLHLGPHPTAHYSMSQFTRGPGTQWQRAGPGVNLTHLWFETSDLKCFTELWSHNAPIPANKCFSQRPITERRGAGCKAGRGARAGKTPVVSAFYGLLSAWMRSDARYDPGPGWEERHGDKYEQLMGVTTLHSQARPDRKPGWGW